MKIIQLLRLTSKHLHPHTFSLRLPSSAPLLTLSGPFSRHQLRFGYNFLLTTDLGGCKNSTNLRTILAIKRRTQKNNKNKTTRNEMNSNVYCTVRRSFVVLKRAFVLSPPFLSRLLELSHQTHQIRCKWGVLVQLCLSFSLAAPLPPPPLLSDDAPAISLSLLAGLISNF